MSAVFEILETILITKVLFRGFGCKTQTKQPFEKRWHGFGLWVVSNMKM